jgi:hypothetical protein
VHGRCRPEQWQVDIRGVEGFPAYNNPCWNAYNSLLSADFRGIYQTVKDFDLVMMIDSLEHVDKAEAMVILYHLATHNKQVIVSVPLGVCPQGSCFSNDLETHRATFGGTQDFSAFNYRVLHQQVCLVISISGVK